FTATAPPSIYPLSLHDALPILEPAASIRPWAAPSVPPAPAAPPPTSAYAARPRGAGRARPAPSPAHAIAWTSLSCSSFLLVPAVDRKSTRLNSSHVAISYAVFC